MFKKQICHLYVKLKSQFVCSSNHNSNPWTDLLKFWMGHSEYSGNVHILDLRFWVEWVNFHWVEYVKS